MRASGRQLAAFCQRLVNVSWTTSSAASRLPSTPCAKRSRRGLSRSMRRANAPSSPDAIARTSESSAARVLSSAFAKADPVERARKLCRTGSKMNSQVRLLTLCRLMVGTPMLRRGKPTRAAAIQFEVCSGSVDRRRAAVIELLRRNRVGTVAPRPRRNICVGDFGELALEPLRFRRARLAEAGEQQEGDGGDEQRDDRRKAEAADDDPAEGLARLGAGSERNDQRHAADHRGDHRHDYRPEPDMAGCPDRVVDAKALLAQLIGEFHDED